jgi:hypothetical protein
VYSDELYKQFIDELAAAYANYDNGMERLTACLSTTRKYLKLLKEYLDGHPFENRAAEIEFFKYDKPKFYQWLIYYLECYTIENGKPLDVGKPLLRYYTDQLKYINRFFRQNEFHYQYYKLNAVEMDNLYFIRGAEVQQILIPEIPEVNPDFSTSMDYLFAKFMAYEHLQQYVLELMQSPAEKATAMPMVSKKGRATKWTGDTCNLIEIVYGIYDTRQVNDGKVDLSDLMDVFEQCFQVNLSRYFRRFTEIKRRKTMSKTRYLDQMRDAIHKRIDDGDAYQPLKNKNNFERDRDDFK